MKFLQNFESVDKRKGKKNMLDYVYTLRDKILSVDFIMVVDIVFLRLEHVWRLDGELSVDDLMVGQVCWNYGTTPKYL